MKKKKILGAVVALFLVAFALVGLSAKSASAIRTVEAPAAKACVGKVKTKVAHYGDWRFVADTHYRDCAGSSIFDKYVVSILRTNGVKCGDGPGTITEWRINPNVIGWYNPALKTVSCINDSRLNITWNPATGVVVNDSAPSNERCIAANVGVGKNNWPDDSFSIPSSCMP